MKGVFMALAASLALLPVGAAEAACPPEREPSMTLGEYRSAFRICASMTNEALVENVEEAVSARPTSTGGSGFASDLRDTIEDFLPRFNIGIDSLATSDDGKSLEVRFNPIRAGRFGAVGLTAAVTEPEAGAELLASLPEARRSAAAGFVDAAVDDLSDVTLTARWGYERNHDEREPPRRMWGRNVDRYRPIVEQWMGATVEQQVVAIFAPTIGVSQCDELISRAFTPALAPAAEPANFNLKEIAAVLGTKSYEECLKAYEFEERTVEGLDLRLDAFALLPALIDNQPQLVFTVARHERDPLVGRNGWGGKLTYEHGFHNFNSLLRLFHARDRAIDTNAAKAEAFWRVVKGLDLQKVKSENKLTFSAAYEEGEALEFSRTFGEGDDALTAAVDLPRRSESRIKGEYVRNATWHPMQVDGSTVFPRFHASFEYVDVSDDPQRQDRGIAKLTYELPITPTISVPLSLTYANHAEFLGEHDEQLSAHLGFSYKLPWDDD